MATFVIKTDDEEVLGFLLIAECEAPWPPPGQYDCIFSGFPHNTALWDDPRGRFVLDHKHREWKAEAMRIDAELTVLVALEAGWIFKISVSEAGNQWSAIHDQRTMTGTGNFL